MKHLPTQLVQPPLMFKIWPREDASKVLEIEGRYVYAVAKRYAEQHWTPAAGEEMELVVQEPDGTLYDVEIDIAMEPTFDLYVQRREAVSSEGTT